MVRLIIFTLITVIIIISLAFHKSYEDLKSFLRVDSDFFDKAQTNV